MWIRRIQVYGRLIKFSHTVFALPFALASVLLAHRIQPVTWSSVFWVLVAMASARSAAMGFNRYVDHDYDRRNPRTTDRPLASGQIGPSSVLVFIVLSSGLFILSAAALGSTCLALSVPTLGVIFFYSLTKRFTSFSHLFLGLAIGLAPLGAWIAVTNSVDARILLLSLALMTYIAGFDILYACQDLEFDKKEQLYSMPACMGVEKALRVSTALHAGTFIFLVSVYFAFHLATGTMVCLLLIASLLVVEHILVRPGNLSRVNLAFFHVNSAISVLLFFGIFTDTVLA